MNSSFPQKQHFTSVTGNFNTITSKESIAQTVYRGNFNFLELIQGRNGIKKINFFNFALLTSNANGGYTLAGRSDSGCPVGERLLPHP